MSATTVSADDLTLSPTKAIEGVLRKARKSLNRDAQALIQQMLVYAAATERRLAAQAQRIDELENLTVTDELTGLLNRRGFMGALRVALANAQRHGERGIIAYIDLDGFKQINDQLGHAAGDAVLRQFASLIDRSVRRTDFAARLGGDEFAVVLTRTNADEHGALPAKLRRRLSQVTLDLGEANVTLSASIGIASYGAESAAEDLIDSADRAMYREKSIGANCAA